MKVGQLQQKVQSGAAARPQVVLHPALEPPRLALAAWAWLGVLLALAGLVVLYRVTTSDPGLLPRGGARTNGLCAQVPPAPGQRWHRVIARVCLLLFAIHMCLLRVTGRLAPLPFQMQACCRAPARTFGSCCQVPQLRDMFRGAAQVNGRVPLSLDGHAAGPSVLDSPALKAGAWSQARPMADAPCCRCLPCPCTEEPSSP